MIGMSEIFIVILSGLIIIFHNILNKNSPAILNVYQRPNRLYFLKLIFIYCILSFRKLFLNVKSLCKGEEDIAKLDSYHKLSNHDKAIDAVYFNASNQNGDHLVVGTARRKNGLIDGFLYLVMADSGLGVLETPKLPGTSLYQAEEIEVYGAEGIEITPIEPMKKWTLSYRGRMKLNGDRARSVDITIQATFTSDQPYFDFNTDMDCWSQARAIATEKWTATFFKIMKTHYQNHYEQFGQLSGCASIDGKDYNIDMDVVRDHSFGLKREWRDFHRYALHFVSVENGDRFNVGIVSMPITLSSILIGYLYCAAEKRMYPIKNCDLKLYQHGEDGDPPNDYAFTFAAGRKTYTVQVHVVHSPHFYISKDWESKVVERLCTFKINDMKGWGAAEWEYRNVMEKKVDDYVE